MSPLKRILLAEDNQNDVELTLAALDEYNLANEVVVTRDGAETLDYLFQRGKFEGHANGVPAVILLDLKMPKVDGLEALRQLREQPRFKHVPVVMITSSREEQDLVRSYELGVNAYVVKPVDFQKFVECIKQIGFFWALVNEPPPAALEKHIEIYQTMTTKPPLQILHLEDNPYDSELVSSMLADENIPCEMHRVDTRKDFEAALGSKKWDLIISDFALPGYNGLKALVTTREKDAQMPFILFSGTIGEETAIDCLKKGATDYVLKERPARLVSAVRAVLKESEERERRKKYEAELQKSAEREKLMEARFLRMQRMESIGALVSGIAHDLNNALVPVLMGCGFLRSEQMGPESEQVLSTIESSARRGADMLRQVLAFARGVEGKKTPVQTRLLLREMEKIAQDTFPKTIRVRMDFGRDLWPVSGYATQLYQVLMNLCINARDAMPNGGELSLLAENVLLSEKAKELHADARPGPYLVLTVADTGTGMSPEVQEKLFQPFFTTKEFGKGTGLGLSTTLNIVKSHDGFIRVESQVGRGSSFHVYLPAMGPSVPAAESQPKLEGLPAGNGEGILVIDDEASICEITKAALENYNYRVTVAHSGPEAVALYTEKRDVLALAVTDTDMPFMDGHATCAELKKINPNLKIIMASATTSGSDTESRIADKNVSAFVPKPYTVEKLLIAVHDVLTGKHD